MNGSLDLKTIGYKDLLNPDAMKTESEEIYIRSQQVVVKKFNKTIKCVKESCGSYDVFMEEIQTRSADEPPTISYICETCGLKWRPR
jgi:DNA-directed RNA polymerase subunit M/transcription elongation factor TFIIS